VVVGLEDSVVELFHFSHFSDFVSLLVVTAVALHIDTDADSKRNDGDYQGDGNHHNDLVVV